MAILRTKRSRWVAGTVALVVASVGTLAGLPAGGQRQNLPIDMPSISAVADFSPITPLGVVPRDVLTALLIPQKSTRTSWHNYDQGNGQYDREITISVQADPNSTKKFFKAALSDMAWKILSSQDVSNGYEILGLHSGSDGHFWEIGVTISTGSPVPRSGTPNSTDSRSSVALRLLQYESA